jgi:hypothetical protein
MREKKMARGRDKSRLDVQVDGVFRQERRRFVRAFSSARDEDDFGQLK